VNEVGVCRLVSASCTTGWFDWIHGELWLCPDGLLRRPLGLIATVGHGPGPTVDEANRPTRTFSPLELLQITEAGRRNRWLPWSQISHATLKSGIIDHSLHLELGDGRREKFLWLKVDGGFDLLRVELGRVLQGKITVVQSPIG
jgi:hypothetical protein